MSEPKQGFPINPFPPPPIIACATKPPATLAEALVIIETQRQRIDAWQKLERGAESMVPKGDDGPLADSIYSELVHQPDHAIKWLEAQKWTGYKRLTIQIARK